MKCITSLFIFTTLLFSTAVAYSRSIVQEGHYLFDSQKLFLKKISARPELTVDLVSSQGYEVYGPIGTESYLRQFTNDLIPLNTSSNTKSNKYSSSNTQGYPTNDEDAAWYQELAKKYPQFIQVFSIGKTATQQPIWAIKISDNVTIDEVEPEFAYIANMHGNEVVGRRVMLRLLDEMIESYARGEDQFKSLIENNEIFFIPTLNPDGYQKRQRGNAAWVDINRDFPDFASPNNNQNTVARRAEETVAMMNFHAQRHLALSGSFHDGAVVVNYPWDTVKQDPPLHQFIIDLSRVYADKNDEMRSSYEFKDGITNGYAWYEVNGGLQDWAFYYHDNLMITFELSDIKWPKWSEIDHQYQLNRDAMIAFMKKISSGAGFELTNKQSSGRVRIFDQTRNINLGDFPYFAGEFYKVLPVGLYRFELQGQGQETWSFETKIEENQEYGSLISIP